MHSPRCLLVSPTSNVWRAECFSLKGFPLVLSTIFFSQAATEISTLRGLSVSQSPTPTDRTLPVMELGYCHPVLCPLDHLASK
jgi:hypothetical protein